EERPQEEIRPVEPAAEPVAQSPASQTRPVVQSPTPDAYDSMFQEMERAFEQFQGGQTGQPLNEFVAAQSGHPPAEPQTRDRYPLLRTGVAMYKAGLVTGIRTHLRNIGSTGAFQVMEEVSSLPASIVDLATSAVTGV